MNEHVVALPRRFPELTAIDKRKQSREDRLEQAEQQIADLKMQAEEIKKGIEKRA